MRGSFRPLIATILVGLPTIAYGRGADHPDNRPVGGSDKWPAGLKELVNRPERVHGYVVNWEDTFYFAGDAANLSAFVEDYVKLPDTKLQIVLHPGKPEVKSPWDTEPRDVASDWKLYTAPFTRDQVKDGKLQPGPFVTRLDIWIGGQIDFAKLLLILPAAIPVEPGDDAMGDDMAKIEDLLLKLRTKHAEAEADRKNQAVEKTAGDSATAKTEQEHTAWIAKGLREMQTIKPGMTRSELLKVFREEGGLSNAAQRRYAYRECPYIKVDVKFDAAKDSDGRVDQVQPQDKITSISQPFLEWSIMD